MGGFDFFYFEVVWLSCWLWGVYRLVRKKEGTKNDIFFFRRARKVCWKNAGEKGMYVKICFITK